jgi:hypothetical protein
VISTASVDTPNIAANRLFASAIASEGVTVVSGAGGGDLGIGFHFSLAGSMPSSSMDTYYGIAVPLHPHVGDGDQGVVAELNQKPLWSFRCRNNVADLAHQERGTVRFGAFRPLREGIASSLTLALGIGAAIAS